MTRLRIFLEMVRFEHTIFALPYAYMGMVLAANWPPPGDGRPGLPTLWQVVWITVAMGAARTVGFAINRNPRTSGRPIPTGRLSPRATLGYAAVALVVLVVAAWQLNPLTLMLLPGAVLFLAGYSYLKRCTWLSHWVLGATDGLAPAGAWVAVRAHIDPPAWLLWIAVTLWIAGFDLIYACQDTEFDRAERLFSVPARFGNAVALRLAQINHALTVLVLSALGTSMGLGPAYWAGLAVAAGLLVYEHSLVAPDNLSRVNLAFFNVNGYIAVVLCGAVLAALYV
jgi:4-hydroxybenzoate polyprenyltransferase